MPRSKTATTRSARKASRPLTASAVPSAPNSRARTIIYVHGIGNKPRAEILKCQWDDALVGFDLGERSRLAYWVNRVLYPEPSAGNCRTADNTQVGVSDSDGLGAKALETSADGIEALLPAGLSDPKRAVLTRLAKRATQPPDSAASGISAADFRARVLPLPRFMREFITRRITKAFLKDVNELFFNPERREVMRRSLLDRMETGGGPFVVIGHSQGSMIAYDVLSSLPADKYDIELFLTMGSPLGLQEVQDLIKKLTHQPNGLAVPAIVKRWVNVSDPLDPVCADKRLQGDYAPNATGVSIADFVQWNDDSPKDPHSGTGYLRLAEVRCAVQSAIQPDLFQPVSRFTLARDLVNDLENGDAFERHPVLIELLESRPDGIPSDPLDLVRTRVVDKIRALAFETEKELKKLARLEGLASSPAEDGNDADSLERRLHIEALTHYVSANLTRAETERIAGELQLASVYRVFRNAVKRALLKKSIETVHALPAHGGYGARGQGITWAVLDSGIDPAHPHFEEHGNLRKMYDCLAAGPVVERNPQNNPGAGVDRNGHGTHVAGIIAGCHEGLKISGIAPAARIISYKVLDDEGSGRDAKIIKALDHIFDTNQKAQQLVVHGINLSLGGAFNPKIFGCGDSPLCKQLRQLWRQGVAVVIAAGNEGYVELSQGDFTVGTNMDLSIGDPANLEEAIAVGSIHKSKPHLYGISYFSSRGPTADGRGKPDLVAPGERILSCRANGAALGNQEHHLYVELSGTSMAAPHVSGVLAGFLSVRTEFIGYPDLVKQHLLANCTSLKRDPMHQGAGMPNLVKMLLNT